ERLAAAVDDDSSDGGEPTNRVVRAYDAVLDVVAEVRGLQSPRNRSCHSIDVGWMDVATIRLERAFECAGLEPVNVFEFRRPRDGTVFDVPVPRTHSSCG